MHTELSISNTGHHLIDVPFLPNNSRKTASVYLGLFCVTSNREGSLWEQREKVRSS